MKKAEIKRISDFLNDTWEGICEGDKAVTMHGQLNKLYETIPKLMDAAFTTRDQNLKVLLATLEYKAQNCRSELEERLGVRN